jgi:predicted nucleic acid-binding protein
VPLFYIDTSALVKRYHVELGSDQMDRLFADPAASLVTANLAITELTSALDRKCQDGALTREGLTQILAVAAQDLLLVSADARLLQAADREGIELFNPETFRPA